jgi:hypothetical protein
MDIAHNQGYGIFVTWLLAGAEFSAKAVDAELAPAGGEVSGRNGSKVEGHKVIIPAGCALGGLSLAFA